MARKAYAGIGSRQTPPDVLALMSQLGKRLEGDGYVLRSGGASGADNAFEMGVSADNREVYLPWPGFEGKQPGVDGYINAGSLEAWPKALEMVNSVHPAPERLSRGARALHARNAMQALGADLQQPVEAVLAWTPGGKGGGGTGQAIRIARAHGIPVFDMGIPEVRSRIEQSLADGRPIFDVQQAAAPGLVVDEKGFIQGLGADDVFVFGSNRAGRHGLGAALHARQRFGAEYGVGRGLTGQSYALPTKDERLNSLSLGEVQSELLQLGATARENPGKTFYLTRVGQGLAGLGEAEIAGLIRSSELPVNVRPYWDWENGVAPAAPAQRGRYEVSTQGDRRFSALAARLADGRLVEQAWAEAKGYPTMKAAKDRPALVDGFDYYGTYKGIWKQWADENPQLIDELAEIVKTNDLVDSFAKTGNNQARALTDILLERASTPAPERRGAFVIVPSRVPNPDYQHLGMREKGFNMTTAPAPFTAGWLGNPTVASDAGGWVSREDATKAFRGVIEEKAKDPVWRDAFLSLDENTRVGYYKPEEEHIHLHELQSWILENRGGVGGVAPAVAPVREQLELPLGAPAPPAAEAAGGGSAPPPPPPSEVASAAAEAAGPQAAGALAAAAGRQRMAGDLWPWLAAAGGTALLGTGVAVMAQPDEREEEGPYPPVIVRSRP